MIEYLYNSLYGTWKELNDRGIKWKFNTPPAPDQKGIYSMHREDRKLGNGSFIVMLVGGQLQVTLKDQYSYNLFMNPNGKEMTWTNEEEVRHFVLD